MERETFLHIAERAARYPSVQRRGQLVRATVTTFGAHHRAGTSPRAGRGPAFFAGLAARAAGYGGCAET